MNKPLCGKCNDNHYNFQGCPRPIKMSGALGPSFGSGSDFLGAKPGDGNFYNFPPRQRVGRLIGPDGQDYQPPEAA